MVSTGYLVRYVVSLADTLWNIKLIVFLGSSQLLEVPVNWHNLSIKSPTPKTYDNREIQCMMISLQQRGMIKEKSLKNLPPLVSEDDFE